MAFKNDECVIRDVKLRSGPLGPALVNFEHGQLKKNEATDLKCGVFTANDYSSKICTIGAVAPQGDVVYQGDVHHDDADLCRTFLAIRNKRNNKMRIYETSHVMLSPTVASNFVDYFDAQDKKQAAYNLSHAFGSKKAKRIADQRARMEVNVDSVKEKLSTTVNDIEVQEEALTSAGDDSLTKLLPPCFRDAKAPAEVYPVDGLLKNKEIGSLELYYTKAVESEEFDISRMTPLFKHMFKKIAPGNTRSIALLLYAESLAQFCNLRNKQLTQKGFRYCRFSDSVHKRISKDFTTVQSDNISRSQFMTDKAVMFIIILCLHVGAFQVDLDVIAQSINKMDMNRIRMLARIIGTVPSKAQGASKNLVLLKVPLPPPQSLIIRGRKSRR